MQDETLFERLLARMKKLRCDLFHSHRDLVRENFGTFHCWTCRTVYYDPRVVSPQQPQQPRRVTLWLKQLNERKELS